MARSVKVPPAVQETQVWTLGCHDPLEKEVTTHSGTLAGKFHGQRSLAGYRPCSRKESDMNQPSAVWLEECREPSGWERRETESVDRREAAVITEAAMRPHWARGCGTGKKGEPFQRLRLCSSWVPTVRRVPIARLRTGEWVQSKEGGEEGPLIHSACGTGEWGVLLPMMGTEWVGRVGCLPERVVETWERGSPAGWVVHQVSIECVGVGGTDVRRTGFLPWCRCSSLRHLWFLRDSYFIMSVVRHWLNGLFPSRSKISSFLFSVEFWASD